MDNLSDSMHNLMMFYKDKSCLVTGAFGFVGGHVVDFLLKSGAVVQALDIDTSPERQCLINLKGLRDKVNVITADITDQNTMEDIIKETKCSIIFHFAAAATVVEKAMDIPYQTVMANTMGLVNILEAARKSDGSIYSILFSSTDKVYGEATELPYVENVTPLRAIGLYDAAKMAADVLARSYAEVFGVNVVTARLCNLIGPYDFNIDFRLLPKSMKNIYCQGQPPELYFHSLDHWRDYLYIDDAVRAMLLLAKEEKCQGEIYNMPGCKFASTPTMIKEVVNKTAEIERRFNEKTAKQILEQGVKIVMGDAKHVVIEKQHVSGEKIKDAIGFVPEITFDEGLERTILFYRNYFHELREKEATAQKPEERTEQSASME
jgi:nucleoside-diphosphate-sugar epimerase